MQVAKCFHIGVASRTLPEVAKTTLVFSIWVLRQHQTSVWTNFDTAANYVCHLTHTHRICHRVTNCVKTPSETKQKRCHCGRSVSRLCRATCVAVSWVARQTTVQKFGSALALVIEGRPLSFNHEIQIMLECFTQTQPRSRNLGNSVIPNSFQDVLISGTSRG